MPLAGLAPLAGILGGVQQAQQIQNTGLREQLMRLQMQQEAQQQQALGAAGNALGNLPTGIQQGVGQDISSSFGAPQQQQPQAQPIPLVPSYGGNPMDGAGLKASWFGNAPGWHDPSDSGLQAGGRSVAEAPGIALPSRSTLGSQFDVTTPEGRTFRETQTDIGPAKWTGRGVDINATAAEQMGYQPSTFPTDAVFKVKQITGPVAMKQAQGGAPMPVVKEANQTAQQAGAQIPPQQWGMTSLQDLAAAVDKANPGLDPATKFLAVSQLHKLMAPDEQQMFRMMMMQNREALQRELLQQRESFSQQQRQQVTPYQQAELDIQRQRVGQGEERIAQAGQKINPANVALDKYLGEHPEATAEEIQSFIQRGRSARSGPAMAAQRYLQEHPEATSEEIRNFVAQTAAQTSATRQFDVGKQGDTVRSLNVAIDHLAVLSDAASALQNGDVQRLNQVGNIISKELGYPAPTDFGAVKSIVKDELVKAVLGGAGALGDRQEVEEQLALANSPPQMAGVIRRYEQLMGGQMRGLKQQFLTSNAGDEGAFEQKLLPRTREVIKRAGSPAEGQAAPAAGGDISTMSLDQLHDLTSGDLSKLAPGDGQKIQQRLQQLQSGQ
jgi:hypothetical protein